MDVELPERQLRELALFAGAGGGILGGKLLGWRTVCAVEIDAYCRKVLLARQRDGCLDPFPIWDDVRTFDGKPWRGRVDVISGGFPCQDISAAGKGAGITGERSGLWKEFARIIGEVGPRFVFVENSPLLTSRGLGVVLGDLAEMGFDARWGVLGADDAGAPHKRKRIWVVAESVCHRRKTSDRGKSVQNKNRIYSTPSARRAMQQSGAGYSSDVAHTNNAGQCSVEGSVRAERGDDFGGSRKVVANTVRHGEQSKQDAPRWSEGNSDLVNDSSSQCVISHTDSAQREGMLRPIRGTEERTESSLSSTWWGQDPADAPEPELGRMAHGVAHRVDRLKAIGNGQVPAVVKLAWETLSQ